MPADLDLENDAAFANTDTLADTNLPTVTNSAAPKHAMPHARDLEQTRAHSPVTRACWPIPVQQHQQQQAASIFEHAESGRLAGQHGAAPKGWVLPSQMLLPRAALFYCSSFSASCGLPKHSELSLF